jgi:hypothetical protein
VVESNISLCNPRTAFLNLGGCQSVIQYSGTLSKTPQDITSIKCKDTINCEFFITFEVYTTFLYHISFVLILKAISILKLFIVAPAPLLEYCLKEFLLVRVNREKEYLIDYHIERHGTILGHYTVLH